MIDAPTKTYPKGLSVSMQSSLHWSEKRTSFSLLFIIELTSWSLDGDRSKKMFKTTKNQTLI